VNLTNAKVWIPDEVSPGQVFENWNLFLCCFRARRAAKEAKESPAQPAPEKPRVDIKKFVKIGRPGYKGKY
jgi:hypothetical protein